MRVPWTARRANLSILEEIKPECSLEGQMLKLRLQYFVHLMRREDSVEKTLMLGKCEGKRRRGQQRTRWLDSVIEVTSRNLTQSRSQWKTGGPGMLWFMGSRRVGHDLMTKQQQQPLQSPFNTQAKMQVPF